MPDIEKTLAQNPDAKVIYLLPYDTEEVLYTLKKAVVNFSYPWDEDIIEHEGYSDYNKAPVIFLNHGEYLTIEDAPEHSSLYSDLEKIISKYGNNILLIKVLPQWATNIIRRPTMKSDANILAKTWKRVCSFLKWRNFCYLSFYEASTIKDFISNTLVNPNVRLVEEQVSLLEFYNSKLENENYSSLSKEEILILSSLIAEISQLQFRKLLDRRLSSRPILSRKQRIQEVLETKEAQEAILLESNKTDKSVLKDSKELKKTAVKAREILEEIASDTQWRILKLYDKVLRRLWKRFYSKIEVRGMDSVLETLNSKDNTNLVYVSTHRSHIDYLLLSYILSEYYGVKIPNIAAGINLNFKPVGYFLRRGGAFFLRRTFKNNLYKVLFENYVKQTIKESFDIEFFIEGGRSRTGRLLSPKTGMLDMTINGFLANPNANQFYVPVFIAYDKVFESATYVDELSGKKKNKENLFLVLKNLKKVKYQGNVYVNFAKPVSLPDFFSELYPDWGIDLSNNKIDKAKVSQITNALAHLNMQEINANATISGTALISAIIYNSDCKFSIAELEEKTTFLKGILQESCRYNSRYKVTAESVQQILKTLERTAGKYLKVSKEEVVFKRNSLAELNYYRNNIEHCFIPSSLAAISLLKGLSEQDLLDFSQLFMKIFNYNSYTTFTDENFLEQITYFKEFLKNESQDNLELIAKQLHTYLSQLNALLESTRSKLVESKDGKFIFSSIINDAIAKLKEDDYSTPDYADKTSLNQLRIAIQEAGTIALNLESVEKALVILNSWRK